MDPNYSFSGLIVNHYVQSCRLSLKKLIPLTECQQPLRLHRKKKHKFGDIGGYFGTWSLPSKTQTPDVDTIVSHALSNPDTSRHTTLKRRTILKTRANLSKRSPLTIRSFSQPSWKWWAKTRLESASSGFLDILTVRVGRNGLCNLVHFWE